MTKKTPSFGAKFLWGAATAAHQVEGGQHNQWSNWEIENAKSLSAQASHKLDYLDIWSDIKQEAKDPSNYISGRACDHYNRYDEDFDLLQKLNMNAFRFSIEWSRIEPEAGKWDAAAIAHYRSYIKGLRARNIEPVMTLFHFTLPLWFSEMGGFEKRKNSKYFERFVEKVIAELGKDIKYIITINEPGVFVGMSYLTAEWPPMKQNKLLGYRVLMNLAAAHNSVARKIKKTSRRYKVSMAINDAYYYPGDDAWLTVLSTRVLQYVTGDLFLGRVMKQCDFIGLNYYFSNRVYGYRVHNPDERVSDLGWDMQPANIEFTVERLYQKYKKPIMITENGCADMNDEHRKWWISATIAGLLRAKEEGVELIGYLHWSLLDNFEWAYGFWPRFGLVEVDYATQKRTIRPSAQWYGNLIKKMRSTK